LCLGVGIAIGAHFSADQVVAHESAAPTRFDPVTDCAPAAPAAASDREHCPPGRPALASDLTGTWLRVGVQGVWRGVEGREFMRFESDGRFTWGLTGRLTGPYRAVRGHYVDVEGTVTVTVETLSLCRAADTYTWRATLSGENRLHLAYAAGTERACGSAATAVWSARRLQVGHPSHGPRVLTPR
jgi:hypothetical protein